MLLLDRRIPPERVATDAALTQLILATVRGERSLAADA